MPPTRLLFVCLGNICRSPMAQGVFRHLANERGAGELFELDSAGTGAWHIGNLPDRRARETLLARGIDISDLRARQVLPEDFDRFDLLLAMDSDNIRALNARAPAGSAHKIALFLDHAPELGSSDVPDPYYGGRDGFEYVYELLEAASRNLLDKSLARS